MATLALVLLGVLSVATAAPASYDQRQHGELNIHAHLDNIVILLIPSSKVNLMGVSPNKPDQSSAALLELLQNHIQTNEVLHVESAQSEEEPEVEATVQEMTPETTEKTTTPAKADTTEATTLREHSTVSESVQDVVFKISIPVELKDAVRKAEEKVKTSERDTKKEEKDIKKEEIETKKEKDNKKEEKEVIKATEKEEKVSSEPLKLATALKKKEQAQEKKEESQSKKKEESSASVPEGLDALIKPVAARTSTEVAVTGARREKVIRYKPEGKWAPGLAQLLGPARQERQRFGPLCAPGTWDADLRTCIMPGETRSRDELARFLEAMRFGIAIPAQ